MSVKKKSTGKAGVVAICVIAALMLIVNTVVSSASEDISMYLGGKSTVDVANLDYDSVACFNEGTSVATQLEEEGAVLLKNQDNILPLAEGTKVSILGAMSYNYVEGGTGSAGGKDDANTVMMNDAMAGAGLDVNQDLWNWLKDACGGKRGADALYDNITSSNWTGYQTINEFTKNTYESNAKSLIGSYNGYAIVTISRSGSEGASPSMDMDGDGSTLTGKTYLELSDNERDLLTFCKENFEHTIVLINTCSAMELGFVDSENYNIDGCIWIGHPGETGMVGVADIITGKANPSGKLVDTYPYDLSTNPTYYNEGDNQYTNLNDEDKYAYYQYEEGIYVGYRYYETADAAGYFDSQAFKDAAYKNDDRDASEGGDRDTAGGYANVVKYPFGYGLSYGSFKQKITSSDVTLKAHGTNSIKVKVSNDGDIAGKQVVQVYMEAPYNTDPNCGIQGRGMEKAAKVLVGFVKTGIIEPGKSETVTVTFNTDDLAGYDYTGYGCYVLEKGDYKFDVSLNAHEVIDTATASITDSIIYNDGNAGKRDSDQVAAVNQLNDVSAGDGNMLDGYLSRSDFAAGMDSIKQHESGLCGDKACEALGAGQTAAVLLRNLGSAEYTYDYYKNGVKTTATETLYVHAGTQSFYEAQTPDGKDLNDTSYKVTFESTATNYTLADMVDENGKPLAFNDPKWQDLLNQVTLEECINVHGNSGWGTPAVDSIGKAANSIVDGPGEPGNGNIPGGTWFPSAVVIASTWNTELANAEGVAYGHQSILGGYAGAYAPAMNMHRTPFGGRDFEYYSEDGFIAGKIGAQVVAGIQSDGVMVYVKHFVLNDVDTNRNGVMTWANEQAIREIYCKPYELAVKEGGCLGIMASLNRIGMSWGHYGLYNNIVRNEWGFIGYIITDGVGPGSEDLYNPPSLCLASKIAMLTRDDRVDEATYTVNEGTGAQDTLFGQYMLRESMHRMLYQIVATGSTEMEVTYNEAWKMGWYGINGVFGVLILLIYIFGVHRQLVMRLIHKGKSK
ncbi:MAG TPA: glycoside hydrolase family 3 C-terminal domain-containing protein [Mobilitalea sp.]|nr:glycoside hydrolase family 3 C-terminal domain-containing protein [Mobilitalea sp.]